MQRRRKDGRALSRGYGSSQRGQDGKFFVLEFLTDSQLLDRFLHTKARKQQFQLVSPLSDGAERDMKASRVNSYQTGRNLVDGDNSSKLSPYLTSGVISGRMVLNEAKKFAKGKLESGRDTGVGMWVQEVGQQSVFNLLLIVDSNTGCMARLLQSGRCRLGDLSCSFDLSLHQVMATWPRVSMGRPFLEKFADVQWELSEEYLQAWKDGRTGFPIVDAAMRACNARGTSSRYGHHGVWLISGIGWMENRVRMVTACFLVKNLMLDWRESAKVSQWG